MSSSDEQRLAEIRALAETLPAAPWFAKPDDLVGGWCVTTDDRTPAEGARTLASFTSEAAARFIAIARNELLPTVDRLRSEPQIAAVAVQRVRDIPDLPEPAEYTLAAEYDIGFNDALKTVREALDE